MHTGEGIPQVGPEALLSQGLIEMSRKGLGMTAIVDAENRLAGIFTDGDLRRVLDRGLDVHKTRMKDVMNGSCRTIHADALAVEAVHLLEQFKINALLVVNPAGQVVGALNIHDLLRAGVM
jgi:arabinose-5-phosphate isomerase